MLPRDYIFPCHRPSTGTISRSFTLGILPIRSFRESATVLLAHVTTLALLWKGNHHFLFGLSYLFKLSFVLRYINRFKSNETPYVLSIIVNVTRDGHACMTQSRKITGRSTFGHIGCLIPLKASSRSRRFHPAKLRLTAEIVNFGSTSKR